MHYNMAHRNRDIDPSVLPNPQYPPAPGIPHGNYYIPSTTPFTNISIEEGAADRDEAPMSYSIQPAPGAQNQKLEQEQYDWDPNFNQSVDDFTKQVSAFSDSDFSNMQAVNDGVSQQQPNHSNSSLPYGFGNEGALPNLSTIHPIAAQNDQQLRTSNGVPFSTRVGLSSVSSAINNTDPTTSRIPSYFQSPLQYLLQGSDVSEYKSFGTAGHRGPSRAPTFSGPYQQQQVYEDPIASGEANYDSFIQYSSPDGAPDGEKVPKHKPQKPTTRPTLKRKRQDLSEPSLAASGAHAPTVLCSSGIKPTTGSESSAGSSNLPSTATPASTIPATVPPKPASLPVGEDFELKFSGPDEARPHAHRRAKLSIAGDDMDDVAADQGKWIRKIMRAIVFSGYKAPPAAKKSGRVLLPDEAAAWHRWQQDHAEEVESILAMEKFDSLQEVESHAWLILEEMLAVHERGYRLTTLRADRKSKCSVRLENCIAVLKEYAIVRFDVFNGFNVEEFAASPHAFASRKVQNLWVNYNKAVNKDKADKARKASVAEGEQNDDDKELETEAVTKKKRPNGTGTSSSKIMKRFTPEERQGMKIASKVKESVGYDNPAAQQLQVHMSQDPANALANKSALGIDGQMSNGVEDRAAYVGASVNASRDVINLGAADDFESGPGYGEAGDGGFADGDTDLGKSAVMTSTAGNIGGPSTSKGTMAASKRSGHPPSRLGLSKHPKAQVPPDPFS